MNIRRLLAAPILAAALAGGAMLLVAACGDDAAPPDNRPRLPLDEYAARLDEVQVIARNDEKAKLKELGEGEIRSSDGLDQVERDYLRALTELRAAALTAYVAALDGLRPPAVVQGEHNAYANALEAEAEFLTDRADTADDIDTAAELLEGQVEFNASEFRTCVALREGVAAAGYPAVGLNCTLR